MRSFLVLTLTALCAAAFGDEAGAKAHFEAKKARLKVDEKGHVLRLMHGGDPKLTLEELKRIPELTHLEELALNVPPAGDDGWEFLKELPNLKKLTIWHGHEFSSLAPFCDLPTLESATFGGCMGIRNHNRETPEKSRDVSLTLNSLPKLTSLTLYHSPLTPGDAHLAHIVKEFPKLTALRLDFACPRGTETELTTAGLEKLADLKLEKLGIENAEDFSPEMFAAFGKIKTLQEIVIHPNRKDREGSIAKHEKLLVPVKKAQADLKVTYFGAPHK